jgi:excisionase family DNA binding protein
MSREHASIDLVELVRDPSRAAEVAGVQIPALLTQLSAIQASMAARLLITSQEKPDGADGEALVTIDEAAVRLGVSVDWLYRRTKKMPFVVRVGHRHVRFSSSGIDRYIRNRMDR